MSAVWSFLRREPVLLIAAIAAAITCFFIPPDAQYLSYLDFRTLSLLFCLMTLVNGFRNAGLFSHLSHVLCEKAGNLRLIALIQILLCFFRKKPPARQMSRATPATRAEPTTPETVVPTGVSLSAKATTT